MDVEKTLALIKPDAVAAGTSAEIQQLIEAGGFDILAKKRILLTRQRASQLYAEHASKPFFPGLLEFMTSGPLWALVLARQDAIQLWRAAMGPTNTQKAQSEAPYSLRALFGTDGTRNATHGSDSPASAAREIGFFFPEVIVRMPSASEASDLFASVLEPTLRRGLVVLARERPSTDPLACISWLASWLQENNPNKPHTVLQPDSSSGKFDIDDVDDEADFEPWLAKERAAAAERNAAATKVQSNFRGHKARKRVGGLKKQRQHAATKVQSSYRGHRARKTVRIKEAERAAERAAAAPLEAAPEPKAEDAATTDERVADESAGGDDEATEEEQAAAAVKIQSRFRGNKARRQMQSDTEAMANGDEPAEDEETQVTLAMIKPDAVSAGKAEEITDAIEAAGFSIVHRKEFEMTEADASVFYIEHMGKPFFQALLEFITSGPVIVLALEKENAVADWRALMGPTNSEQAKKDAPSSLRALYGIDGTRNAVHGSDSAASAERELDFHFSEIYATPPDVRGSLAAQASRASTMNPREKPVETTLAMIKPDAVAAGKEDEIADLIEEAGFTVLHRKQYQLSEEQVRVFYAAHVGKDFFPALCEFMTSGPIVALALQRRNAVRAWRDLMGPTNPENAKEEDPDCLRALFGTDGTRNAVHGSDSAESAALELAFHFADVLASKGRSQGGEAAAKVEEEEESLGEQEASEQEQAPVEAGDDVPAGGDDAGGLPADAAATEAVPDAPEAASSPVDHGDGAAAPEASDTTSAQFVASGNAVVEEVIVEATEAAAAASAAEDEGGAQADDDAETMEPSAPAVDGAPEA